MIFAGLVLDYNEETGIVTIEQRNHFKPGHEVEFFGPEIEKLYANGGENLG